MDILRLSYNWTVTSGSKGEKGKKAEGRIAVFVSGRQCAFVSLEANPPQQRAGNIWLAVCSYLGRENVHALVFYHLQSFRSQAGGPRWLLPSATRCYFRFASDGALVLTQSMPYKLREDTSLVKMVMAYLHRTDLAVVLDKVLAQKVA